MTGSTARVGCGATGTTGATRAADGAGASVVIAGAEDAVGAGVLGREIAGAGVTRADASVVTREVVALLADVPSDDDPWAPIAPTRATKTTAAPAIHGHFLRVGGSVRGGANDPKAG